MIPVLIPPLPTHYMGDTWKSLLGFGPILIDDAQPPNYLVSCRMQFRDRSVLGYELNSAPEAGEGTLTITNSATWEIAVPGQPLPLTSGIWLWDFETVDSEDIILTLYKGSIRVEKDVTYD